MLGRLIYTVMCMSDRLLTQPNPNLQLLPQPELRVSIHPEGRSCSDIGQVLDPIDPAAWT
jgi:hypothetical protein